MDSVQPTMEGGGGEMERWSECVVEFMVVEFMANCGNQTLGQINTRRFFPFLIQTSQQVSVFETPSFNGELYFFSLHSYSYSYPHPHPHPHPHSALRTLHPAR